MGEEEILEIVKKEIQNTYAEGKAKALQGLLELYNKEKAKNIKLQKRNDRQVKIINKKDKQIEELKQIAHNDFEERCRLTFELQKFLEENNK